MFSNPTQFDPEHLSYPQKETDAMRAPGTGEKSYVNSTLLCSLYGDFR